MSKKIKVFLLTCVLMLMCCMGMTVMASEETTAEVMGHSLTITDTGISVNFYVDIQGLIQNNVEVTLNNKKVEIPNETKEIIIDAKAYNLYVFTQPVVAKEMDDKVSLTITSGDEELVKDSYCVNDYVAEVQKGGYSLNFENLANAMTYYGEFAEVYFGYNGATNVTDEATSSISNVTPDSFDGYVASVNKENMPEGLKYYGTQLNLNSKITLRILFEIEEGYTASSYGNFAADGTDLGQLKKVGDYYCVDITGIGAAELGRGYTITCNGEEIITNCSVLTYARAVVRAYSDKENATDKQKSLLNVSKALYLYNQKAVAYVSKPTTVFDIFYNGNGFYAEPSFTNKVYLTADKEVTTVSEGNTAITALSQLNGSRTKSCSVWMQTAYTPSENETLTGPYVMRRYADNISVLNIEGTATIASTVDGRLGEFVAQYPDGSSQVNITQADNGEVYVSGNLNVTGSAKTGVIKASSADVIINAEGLTAQGEVVFPKHDTQQLAGDGEISAIKLVDDGHGHFGAYETAEGLNLGSVICGCGDNISQEPNHSCAWITAQGGIQAAYDLEWKPWTPTSSLPNSGSYYLTQEEITSVTGRSTISSGTVNLDLAGCKVKSAPSTNNYDGMFYRVDNGTLNIADSSGGNGEIYMNGGTNLYGSMTVWNNAAACINIFGGTISAKTGTVVTIRTGHVNMYGGTILPGEKPENYAYANAVQVGTNQSTKHDLNVYSGIIKGEVLISKAATFTITGDAQVGIKDEAQPEKPYGIKAAAVNLTTINCEGITAKASVVLENLDNVPISGQGDASAIKFKEDGAGHFGAYETEEGLKIGSIICGCGANISQAPNHSCAWTIAHTDAETETDGLQAAHDIDWKPWTPTTSLPNSGSYYLMQEEITSVTGRSTIQNGAEINLDLAGCKVKSAPSTSSYDGMFYRVDNGTLNIADSSGGNGEIYMNGDSNLYGSMTVWSNAAACINIFGGTISAKTGTAVTIRTGYVNMYGGTILPGEKPENYAYANAVQVGTNQSTKHDLNVYGGIIKGEVLISKAATFTITGDAQVGIKDEAQPEKPYGIKAAAVNLTTINCEGITAKASVVLENLDNVPISGQGDASAIEFIEDGAGHFGAYETEEGLKVGSIICGCGANISQAPDHSCAWTEAQGGIAAAYALEWTEWTPTTSLPNSGSYYLTQEKITGITGRSTISSGIVNLDLAGCTIESAPSTANYEGMFYRVDSGTLNIADSSKDQTGTIYMNGDTNHYGSMAVWNNDAAYINIFGGTISAKTGTVATLRRGHINMYGGTILPGEKPEDYAYANAVQVGIGNNNLTNLNVSGGTIKGEVIIQDTNNVTLTITGNAQVGIKENEQSEKPYGIGTVNTITSAQVINFSNTSGNVVLKDTKYLALAEGATGDASKFTIIDKHNQVVNVDESETLGYAAYMCVCGKADGKYDHTDDCEQPESAWQLWTDTATLPTTEGSHYLTADVNVTGTRNNITGGIKVNLDLAGHTVTGAETTQSLYRLQNATLNIADSSTEKTGTMKAIGTSNMDTIPGRVIYVWGSGTGGKDSYANIFGGTFDASEAKAGYGTAITISKGSVTMYDGIVIAGSSVEGHANSVEIGIATGTDSILNVEGGTIYGEVLLGNDTASLKISDNAKVGIEVETDETDAVIPYGIGTTSLVTSAKTINCENVTADASVVIKNLDKVGVTGTGEGSAFTILETSRNQIADDSKEGIGNLIYEAYMCVCGKVDGKYDHTDGCEKPAYAWEPWTSTTGLPTENGSFYLTQNLTGLTTRSQIADGKDINLDLAGYTVEGTGNGGVLYRIQRGSLNLADSSAAQTGAIKAIGESTGVGRALYVWGNQGSKWNANIFGGTLCAETGVPVAISRGNINMYGGNILAGTSVEYTASEDVKFMTANSVQVGLYTGAPANLNVVGGTITGEVLIGNETSSTVAVSDNAKIGVADGTKAHGIGIISVVTSTQTITCDNVTDKASVVLKNSHDVTVSGTGEGSAFSIIDQHNKVVDDNAEGIGNLSFAPQMCVCGAVGEHTQIGDCAVPQSAWLPWSAAISRSTYDNVVKFPTTSFSYYLIADMTGEDAPTTNSALTSQKLTIDLADHTVDASDKSNRLFILRGGTLNLTDSVGGGIIKNAPQDSANVYDGKVIWIHNTDTSCVNFFGGTLTADGTNVEGASNNGSTVAINTGTFNMYGGTVVDNGGEDEDIFKAFNNHSKYNYVDGIVIEDGLYKRGEAANTFRAGFGKTDISPENGVSLASYGNQATRLSTGVLSPLEAVATVVTDEEDNTLILVVTDLSWGKIASANQIRELVYKAYGIPYENVLIGGTHNHSAPDSEYTDNELNVAYLEYWKTQVMSAIRIAMRDRKAATMEIGRTNTENMVFSRRYLCLDGKYIGGGPDSYNESNLSSIILKHESEADEEIQMLRFVREGENEKDILITQWQSHACNIDWDREGTLHYMASGEWPQIIRSEVEDKLGVHCMYMQGAAGNLASMSRISSENLYNAESDSSKIGYNDYVGIGKKVASYVIDACNASDGFQAVESGLIQTNQYKMPAMLRATGNPAAGNNRAELNTVAIGDVSLVTLPSELFDTSGKEIKDAAKDFFKMTLIMGYTCGKNQYEAPAWAVDHGCYEVENGRYQLGTAEIMVEHYIDTLEELYNIKKGIQEPTVEESPEEAKVLKVLTLGHSLALDSGHLLNLICDAQGIGDYEEVVIGTLYHSGCTMSEHTSYMLHKSKEYDFYLSSSKTPNEPPTIESGVNLADALAKDYWDIVVMQDGVFDIANSSNYTNGNSHIIQRFINKNKLNTRIRFAWHMTWVAPTDNTLRDKYPYEPNTYYTNYEKYNDDRTTLYNAVVKCVRDHVVTDESFDFIIPSATAFENALSSYLTETDLHRDYVHATDLGRVIASYTWYCKLMGIDKLEEIKLSAIPVKFFKSTTGTEDLVLTDKEKAVILESVNNALANPFKMTQSQYTQ